MERGSSSLIPSVSPTRNRRWKRGALRRQARFVFRRAREIRNCRLSRIHGESRHGGFSAGRGTFITWLLSITHNLSIDEIRRRRRRPQKAESEEPEQVLAAVPDTGAGADVEDEVWLGALRDTFGVALAQLPPAHREAIEMADFQGLTQREIAEALGEPLGTIKTRMRLGLQKLRDALGSDGANLA